MLRKELEKEKKRSRIFNEPEHKYQEEEKFDAAVRMFCASFTYSIVLTVRICAYILYSVQFFSSLAGNNF